MPAAPLRPTQTARPSEHLLKRSITICTQERGPSTVEGRFEGANVRLPPEPTPIANPAGLENREAPTDPYFALFVVPPN
jgi:hypothetical protein